MIEGRAAATRFVRIVGWSFLVASGIGLVVSVAQVALLSRGGDIVPRESHAHAAALGLAGASLMIAVVSVAFLKRRRWARLGVATITVIGMVASLVSLLAPSDRIEPPPPGAPAEYVRLLRLISVTNVVVPIGGCVVLAWILRRLLSPAVRDQFR